MRDDVRFAYLGKLRVHLPGLQDIVTRLRVHLHFKVEEPLKRPVRSFYNGFRVRM